MKWFIDNFHKTPPKSKIIKTYFEQFIFEIEIQNLLRHILQI